MLQAAGHWHLIHYYSASALIGVVGLGHIFFSFCTIVHSTRSFCTTIPRRL